MLRLILKKLLSFSAIAALGLALLMLNPRSPSLVSEARADCYIVYYQTCMGVCYQTCGTPQNPNCPPWDVYNFCDSSCRAMSGC